MKQIIFSLFFFLMICCNKKTENNIEKTNLKTKNNLKKINLVKTENKIQANKTELNGNVGDSKNNNICTEIGIEILESSEVYKKLTNNLYQKVIENGGLSFGIIVDSSPNFPHDNSNKFSENYEFSVHETYPERILNIGMFTFDPKNGKLFHYDTKTDELESIEFDKIKLEKFRKKCK